MGRYFGRRRRYGVSGIPCIVPSQPRPPPLPTCSPHHPESEAGRENKRRRKRESGGQFAKTKQSQPSSRGERCCSLGPSRYAAPQQQACRNANTTPWATGFASRRRRCLRPLASPPPRRDRPH